MRQFGLCSSIFCACLGIVLFVSPFLLGYSFSRLKPTEMGFRINKNTYEVHYERLYNTDWSEAGRHFLGLGQDFLKFPNTYQTISCRGNNAPCGSIAAKTAGGIDVEVQLALQYQLPLNAAELKAVYQLYGEDTSSAITPYIRSTSRDVFASVNVQDLWERREQINDQLRVALRAELSRHKLTLHNVQLLNMDIPTQIQSAILNTTVQFQKIEEAQFSQEAANISAITERLVATEEGNKLLLSAQAAAEEQILSTRARVAADVYSSTLEGQAWANVSALLDANSTQTLAYIWVDSMLRGASNQLVVAVDTPSVAS